MDRADWFVLAGGAAVGAGFVAVLYGTVYYVLAFYGSGGNFGG